MHTLDILVLLDCEALLVGTDVDARLVGVLKIGIFEEELAVVVHQFGADVVVLVLLAHVTVTAGQDRCLPRSRPTVDASGLMCTVGCLAQFGPGLVMHPPGACRLGQNGSVETRLLVRRGPEVIVREDHAEAPVHALDIDDRVREPALHTAARAAPRTGGFRITVAAERRAAEERVR